MAGNRNSAFSFSSIMRMAVLSGLLLAGLTGISAAGYIAGVEPGKRRADIPVMTEVRHDDAWRKQALSGISEPYPQHVLDFLKDQGNWFSPFLHPGMTGRYDIRGWHRSEK